MDKRQCNCSSRSSLRRDAIELPSLSSHHLSLATQRPAELALLCTVQLAPDNHDLPPFLRVNGQCSTARTSQVCTGQRSRLVGMPAIRQGAAVAASMASEAAALVALAAAWGNSFNSFDQGTHRPFADRDLRNASRLILA